MTKRILVRCCAAFLLGGLVVLGTGCGSSDAPAAKPAAVPPAKTQKEWLDRLVNRFLRDMSENLNVVDALRTPQVMTYVRTGNQTTIRVLRQRMRDLGRCTRKLDRVGPPPASKDPLDRIYASFRKSCPPYERVAKAILKSIPLLSSGDSADVADGQQEFAQAGAPSREAALDFGAAVDLLQGNQLLDAYQG